MKISIISSSIRKGRKSHRVALYFKKYIEENLPVSVQILDLNEYKFPLFEERLKNLANPGEDVKEFAQAVSDADGIIIVTPEYNGAYPASLKNVIDLLFSEWKRKSVAIATVSDGVFGGTQVITSLLFTLWKIGAWVVPARYHVSRVHENYDEEGNAIEKEATDKRAKGFVDELLWCMEASGKMKLS